MHRGAGRVLGVVLFGGLLLGACQQTTAPPARGAATSAAPVAPAPRAPAARAPAPIEDENDDSVPLWVRSSWRLPSSIACRAKQSAASEAKVGQLIGKRLENAGSLDKEIIRRVMRRHTPAVRACYEAVMVSKPFPSGRVVARFAIDAAGKVQHSCLASTTLNQPSAEACIVDELRRWEFPKPLGGGWVQVEYPFVLVPNVPDAPKDEESETP